MYIPKMRYFMFLLIFAIARSEDTCDRSYTNIHHEKVDLESQCSTTQPCVVKCCPLNQIYFQHNETSNRICKNKTDIMNEYKYVDWTKKNLDNKIMELKIYKDVKGKHLSSKKFDSFTILQSDDFRLIRNQCVASAPGVTKPRLMENGKLSLYVPSSDINSEWEQIDTSMFCVDLYVYLNEPDGALKIRKAFMLLLDDPKDAYRKHLFVAITFTISSFFLVLVLIVYPLTDMLKSLQGLLLFAYAGTLLVAQLIKATFIFATLGEEKVENEKTDCTLTFQFSYFFSLASFFWLNVMSFDVWWTFRGRLKKRAIHRRGIRVKFMIYALYAYGAPAAMTIFAVVIDNLPARTLSGKFVTPGFHSCLPLSKAFYYFYVPVIILTGLNTFWFLFTVYNIWQSKKEIDNFDKRAESTKTKSNIKIKNKKTFWMYIRLSLLMGISWILELSQSKVDDDKEIPLWGYVILNLYTVLTGFFIFIMFVCKRDVILKLCKRFNIENRWTRRLLSPSRYDSDKTTCKGYSRSTARSKVADIETDLEDPPCTDHKERYNDSQENHALCPKFTNPTDLNHV